MLFKNKYRVESTRLKEWDYSTPWWYYVTIDTKNRIHYFGKIENGKMILNSIGKIAEEEWINNKTVRENIDLDCFIIMPNHIHGIIIINESVETTGSVVSNEKNYQNKRKNEAVNAIVSTTLQPGSLGSVMGQFKSVCTKRIHMSGCENFAWQKGFYDRIIRNEKELYNIRKYIINNPIKWYYEKNNASNTFEM